VALGRPIVRRFRIGTRSAGQAGGRQWSVFWARGTAGQRGVWCDPSAANA